MGQCHYPILRTSCRSLWRGQEGIDFARSAITVFLDYRTSCTTCLRMVSQGNEQIQEKLRRHHLSVSKRCNVVVNLIRLEGADRTHSLILPLPQGPTVTSQDKNHF